MSSQEYRVERDSMGEVKVPKSAYYGAQTQRAVENFPVSGITFPPRHRRAERRAQARGVRNRRVFAPGDPARRPLPGEKHRARAYAGVRYPQFHPLSPLVLGQPHGDRHAALVCELYGIVYQVKQDLP